MGRIFAGGMTQEAQLPLRKQSVSWMHCV